MSTFNLRTDNHSPQLRHYGRYIPLNPDGTSREPFIMIDGYVNLTRADIARFVGGVYVSNGGKSPDGGVGRKRLDAALKPHARLYGLAGFADQTALDSLDAATRDKIDRDVRGIYPTEPIRVPAVAVCLGADSVINVLGFGAVAALGAGVDIARPSAGELKNIIRASLLARGADGLANAGTGRDWASGLDADTVAAIMTHAHDTIRALIPGLLSDTVPPADESSASADAEPVSSESADAAEPVDAADAAKPVDELAGQSRAELAALADSLGIEYPRRASKTELAALIHAATSAETVSSAE